MVTCAKSGASCIVYTWNSGSNTYVNNVVLTSWSGVTYMQYSPDGMYICLIGYNVAQLFRKNNNNNDYPRSDISDQGMNFVQCDMSNNRLVFVGGVRIRILNKQSNGRFADVQNIDTASTTVCVKISFFNNWIFVGNRANQLQVYAFSPTNNNYYLYETLSFTNYVADIDISYDTRTLLVAVYRVRFYIYNFDCMLIPHCISCITGVFCDECNDGYSYSTIAGVGCVPCPASLSCNRCDTANSCSNCGTNFALSTATGQCVTCSLLLNCDRCDYNDVCAVCKFGYSKNPSTAAGCCLAA